MKLTLSMAQAFLIASVADAAPLGKVLKMITELEEQIQKDGEKVQKEFAEFSEFCEDRSRALGFEIKTGDTEYDSLHAFLEQAAAMIQKWQSKAEELIASIATDEADLTAASQVRAEEALHFEAEERVLKETLDMLRRAGDIIERQMQRGGTAMLQMKGVTTAVQAFQVIVQASLLDTADASRLTAFVQSSQKQTSDSEEEDGAGAPSVAVYQSLSGNILDTIQGLAEKAEEQMDKLRQQEVTNQHNFDQLRQSLLTGIENSNSDLDHCRKDIAETQEKKSIASQDLWDTGKTLSADERGLLALNSDCREKAGTLHAEAESRQEELKALAAAKQALQEASSGGALAFLQLGSELSSSTDLVQEATRFVRHLARKQHSQVLAQLASKMASSMRAGEPFDKVKVLITSMISKLEAEAGADANKKAFCDKELAETKVKKEDTSEEIGKLGTKIEQLRADAAKLKEETADLETDLGSLAKAQAEMDTLRQEEKAEYATRKALLDNGIAGVKTAIKILREYYAQEDKNHDAAEGAGSSIISLLEVVESDFMKGLTESTVYEERSVREYEQATKDNEVQKTVLEQDGKYKTKEAKSLDKTGAELTNDRSGVQSELDAVLQYQASLQKQCIARAETYEARQDSRTAELEGLKTALQTLESETALIQASRLHRARHASFLAAH